MAGFLIRLAIGMLGLWMAQAIVPGDDDHGLRHAGTGFSRLGVVNALVRRLLVTLTFPIPATGN